MKNYHLLAMTDGQLSALQDVMVAMATHPDEPNFGLDERTLKMFLSINAIDNVETYTECEFKILVSVNAKGTLIYGNTSIYCDDAGILSRYEHGHVERIHKLSEDVQVDILNNIILANPDLPIPKLGEPAINDEPKDEYVVDVRNFDHDGSMVGQYTIDAKGVNNGEREKVGFSSKEDARETMLDEIGRCITDAFIAESLAAGHNLEMIAVSEDKHEAFIQGYLRTSFSILPI